MWTCPKCKRDFKKTNQSHYCGEAPKNIEEYINMQNKNKQDSLNIIHKTIKKAIPDIEERIAWSMPYYYYKGNSIISFVANKNFISLYVGELVIENFKEQLKTYKTKKGAIYLSYTETIPTKLISDIIKWCYVTSYKSK